ncbi:hypothetical protein [Pseudomonas putida]|uniref:hypothetical protein n=1 Tax=Pseudomonas putida TaxID=303 RepID=UPI00066B3D3D|nr:hypothetical protein [Pseudomonas putida]MBH3348693.1 hypothetical protein [Pseudomonas putida]
MIERMGITNDEDAALWDDLVQQLLGPTFLSDPPDLRRRRALQIAAAAMRAAGESELIAQIDQLLAS